MAQMARQRPQRDSTLLFVYGTLRRGFDHPLARRLALQARYLGGGRMAGRLYRVGGFPGLVLSQRPGEWVYGDLYDLTGACGLLKPLDRYEGLVAGRGGEGEYRRALATAVLESGAEVEAWVYCYARPVHGLPRLVSGDFLRQRRRPLPP